MLRKSCMFDFPLMVAPFPTDVLLPCYDYMGEAVSPPEVRVLLGFSGCFHKIGELTATVEPQGQGRSRKGKSKTKPERKGKPLPLTGRLKAVERVKENLNPPHVAVSALL